LLAISGRERERERERETGLFGISQNILNGFLVLLSFFLNYVKASVKLQGRK
jgi:hypothetical protein